MKNYNYGIIGNCTSAALVSSDASIDWFCVPYFDSASLFAKILDDQQGGFFKIEGINAARISQRYVTHTAILKTVIETKDGIFEINDYMPRFLMAYGEVYCPSEIHRNIRVISGQPRIRVILDPRPNYALGGVNYSIREEYLKITSEKGEYNSFYLYSNLDYQKIISGAEISIPENCFILLSYHEKLDLINNEKIYIEYEKTKTYWLDWVQRSKCPSTYRDIMIRSLIVLKLLMYQRTGAVIAAPTTSLPEIIGRDRNWDYRYCWVRDASMIIDLYLRMGHLRSATRFIDFILSRMLLKRRNIGVMYGIHGEEQLTEKTLEHLPGYENSRPVRIGNDAYRQTQNDLYGELIETIYTYFVVNRNSSRDHLNEEIWTVVRSLVNHVIAIWKNPDSGIWERREALQHYVHSKLMSWVAMDRAVKIARFVGKIHHCAAWLKVANEIREEILKYGWNDQLKSFTMFYGSDVVDASNLLMLHYGFLDPKDPRMVSTVEKSYQHLVKNGFAFRYVDKDEFGLPENAFIVCSFWMINALYLIGQEAKAREMLENVLSCRNDLGLFSEDVETHSRRLTGNFPQGYSHLACIQSILLLETEYNWSDAFSATHSNRL
ncbi:MAG: glycoside hydrolase family 15 protein [Candidatus Omnitrophica bacterium]|nr:glycoside hydrolase family 15 protein [Candidatus Omnitrophota bacterium]